MDSFISGGGGGGAAVGDRKRRRVSGGGGGYDPSTGGMFDTPQPRAKDPWAEQPRHEAVPDLLSWVGDKLNLYDILT